MHLDPNHLTALGAILRLGSFEAAANSLGLTPSAVSQRLRALEERVGATLVHRTSPAGATPLGARLAKLGEDIALLESQVLADRPAPGARAPRLTLAVPADSLATWLVPALAAVPDMLFDLRIDDQDTSVEWLRRGSVSAAVTSDGATAPGCDRHGLGELRYLAVASPAFVAKHLPEGSTAEGLSQAPVLTFSEKDQLQHRWMTLATGQRLHPPSHQLPSTHAFVEACLQGLGWGMNPASLVADHIRAGRLVPLWQDLPLDVPLCWQVSRVMGQALAPLTRALRAEARRSLLQPDVTADRNYTYR